MNLQRWVDRAAELHLAEVARLVDQVHDDAGRPPIVIAATDENAAIVRRHLGRQAADAVIGQIGNARDMGEQQLLEELAGWADDSAPCCASRFVRTYVRRCPRRRSCTPTWMRSTRRSSSVTTRRFAGGR
jgi:hypothetical protein